MRYMRLMPWAFLFVFGIAHAQAPVQLFTKTGWTPINNELDLTWSDVGVSQHGDSSGYIEGYTYFKFYGGDSMALVLYVPTPHKDPWAHKFMRTLVVGKGDSLNFKNMIYLPGQDTVRVLLEAHYTNDSSGTDENAGLYVWRDLFPGMNTIEATFVANVSDTIGLDFQCGKYRGAYHIFRQELWWLNDPPATSVDEMSNGTPKDFGLMQNYPNPFNPETIITFNLPKPGVISLNIYNILGQKVRTLAEGWYERGPYKVEWNGRDDRGVMCSSGIYFYEFDAGDRVETRKMVLER